MKKRITFLFDNYSSSASRRFYETERLLDLNDSIRKAGISVVNEAIRHGLVDYSNEVDDERAIAVYISSSKIADAETGCKELGFGIKYSINKDGTIKVLSGYEPLYYDWRLSELEELVSEGYIKGDTSRLIVVLPTGLGAPLQDLFDWIGFVSATFAMIGTAGGIFLFLNQLIADYNIRKIVKLWGKNGIKYPEQLREFIDVKGEWKLDEVKKRLKLSDEYAIRLLYALGFEPISDSWRLTHSKKSIVNRKRWVRNEKEYRKKQEIIE